MRPNLPDKALFDLIDEFAATAPDDRAAILDLLPLRAAAQVRALLAAYTGTQDVYEMREIPSPTPMNTTGLSDWLAHRVLCEAKDREVLNITPETLVALQEISATLLSGPEAVLHELPPINPKRTSQKTRSSLPDGSGIQ